MYPKDQMTYSVTVEAIEKCLDTFKLILKKQMLQFIRKWRMGVEYEEICYNVVWT